MCKAECLYLMEIPITYKFLKEIVRDWDIEYIKNNSKPNGEIDYERYRIIINIANQPIKEIGISLLHELLHVLYDNQHTYTTELQIETEARHYYEKTDILDYIYAFL